MQLLERDAILELAKRSNRHVAERRDQAVRGRILDRDGAVLAQSHDAYELTVTLDRVPQSPAFFLELANAVGISASELREAALAGTRSLTYHRRLSLARARHVQEVRRAWRADGVSLSRVEGRQYPLGALASGVVGRVADGRGLTGIEAAFDEALRGRDGYQVGMVDRSGAFLPSRTGAVASPRLDGEDVTLTLDRELQEAAAQAIRRAVEQHHADRGVAIVTDPETGDVLAMANWPSGDPEQGGAHDFNPAYQAVFEPGSTFKVLVLPKALDAGVVDPGRTARCTGSLPVTASRSVRCDGGRRGHGEVDPRRAIAVSCNVSAARWALALGFDAMTRYLSELGLLEPTGVGLPAETRGLFRPEPVARTLQLANLGIGQALCASPLALASAFAALANDGVRMKPRLVLRVGGREVPPEPAGRVFSPEAARFVREAMEDVVQERHGTGYALRIPGYRIAGKTGTAQKANPETGSIAGGGYVANFVGFVPARDPRVMILVMIDNPKPLYYGAVVAGPAFREIALAVIRRYHLPPDETSAEEPRS